MHTCSTHFILAAGVSCLLAQPLWAQEPAPLPTHPVLDHGIDPAQTAAYERSVERLMGMSESEMLSFVPERHYARFCECPNCYGGVQGYNIFTWSIERPEELVCKFCKTVVHPNPAYQETETLSGTNRLGETISHPYYYNPERQRAHFITDHLMLHKRIWLIKQCQALGRAYQATRNEAYARRAVLVLDRIAEVYTHYAVMSHGSMPLRHFKFAPSQEPPYTWDAGRWGWHSPADEVPVGVIETYDMVYDSPVFATLSGERGYDVRERFERDFLADTFAALQAWPNHANNYVGYLAGVVNMGRVIGAPGMVRWAFDWVRQNVYAGCFYDGMWHESPSYHYMTIGGLRRCFDSLRGYSDPPGYTDPADGSRFDDLDPETAVPLWAKVPNAPKVLDFPDGSISAVHDTWGNTRTSEPRESSESTILPGFGHLALGCGTGLNQVQAQLHFSGAYGHHHRDNLNLSLYAKGMEMLSDIGYTWTTIRRWTGSTISHNTVAVNSAEQGTKNSDGDLLWFFPDTGGIAVAEADGKRAYRDIDDLDTYRRLLVLIPLSPTDAYVVDLFRVRGGSTHDWIAHGAADQDMTARCSLPLSDWNDALQGDQANASPDYDMLRKVVHAETDGDVSVTFAAADEPQRGIRMHLLADGASDLFLGESPSVRRAGRGSAGDNRKALDYWMPHLIFRRGGEAPLSSVFAAVHEPFGADHSGIRITRLEVDPPAPQTVALRITHGDLTDTLISTLDQPPYPSRTTASGISLRGRLGVVRQRGDTTLAMWLYEGEELSAGETRLTLPTARYTGRISAATRREDGAAENALITPAELPPGTDLRGTWMIVTHGNGYTHGYKIERIERGNDHSRIILTDDHGLSIEDGKTREVYFPQRTLAGENTFVIPQSAHLGARAITDL